MFSRFSVKKPLTVFVGVILVLVLGVVAFSKMTPDLLPNINMPYAVIITSYPGATPEEVESEITKPIEQSMATLDNIKRVTSTSRENSSQVMLELTDDANMDTLTSEIREKLNGVSGAWSDTVGTPYIMKINPSMLPVTVAAVAMDGMDNIELTNLLNTELLVKLEGVEGVASVSTSGNAEENVEVNISQEKIDRVNARIREKLDDTFSEAEAELNEKSEEIDSGLSQTQEQAGALEAQRQQLEQGQNQLVQQSSQAKSQLIEKKEEMEAAKAEITRQLSVLQEAIGPLKEAQSQLLELQDTLTGLEGQIALLQGAIESLQYVYDNYNQAISKKAATQEQIDALGEGGGEELEHLNQQLFEINESLSAMEATMAANSVEYNQIPVKIEELQAALSQATEALEAAKATIFQTGTDPDTIGQKLTEVNESLAGLEESFATLSQTAADLDVGSITVNQALEELNRQQSSGLSQISSGLSQIMEGKSAISSAQAQLTDAREQLTDAAGELQEQKEIAYESANLEITMEMVSGILTAQNFSMPAGYIQEDDTQCLVRVGNKLEDLEELKNLLLFDTGTDGIGEITLSDVADVKRVTNAKEIYTKVDGNDSVALSFTKQSTYSTAQVSRNIQQRFSELTEKYDGLSFTVLNDQGDYIYIVVDTVLQNLVLGAVLAVLILLLFLKDIRPTMAIAFSIPISLLVAIVLMYFSGVSLNVISLSGLAVGVGMLVDNSVVVIENIYRLRSEGASAAKASVQGAVQVTGAIIASTFTTVCVFLPIVFVEGITRQLFTDMALTIAYSLLASLFVAITLVPAMTSTTMKSSKPKSHRLLDRLLAGYEKLSTASLNHKWIVLVLAVVLLVVSVTLSMGKGFAFMPSMSGTQLTVTVKLPDEEATFEEKTEMADKVSQRIMKLDAVETIGAIANASGGGMMSMTGGNSQDISVYVIMKENAGIKDKELSGRIKEVCADLDCQVDAQGSMDMTSYMSSAGGSGIELKLYGENMDNLIDCAQEVTELITEVEGIESAQSDLEDSTPEYRVVVDKNKAMKQGLTVAQVFQNVSRAIASSATATSMEVGGIVDDVLVISPTAGKSEREQLKGLVMEVADSQTGEIKEVALSDIASFEERQSLNSIRREDQKRLLSVSASIAEGYNVSLVARDVEKALEQYKLPEGVLLETAGENTTIMEALEQLVYMALLAVLIIYLIMVIQFQSLLSPFIVMFTIPLAFTGGFAALYLCGMEVSVVSVIGFIMLSGIIVNNGIVLIDTINQLRLGGMGKREAILQAGRTRMRPILMTVLTTVLGLLFMAIGTGMGAELMQPIAIVCIGGLLYATLMTLFVVPAMYEILSRREMKEIDVDS